MIRSLLKFLAAYTLSLIELIGQLFGYKKTKGENCNHGYSNGAMGDREVQRKSKRKRLIRRFKRLQLVLATVLEFETTTFQKLENEDDQKVIQKTILDLAYARSAESRWIKKTKIIIRKFKRKWIEIPLPKLYPPSSSPECLINILPLELWETMANYSGDAQSWINFYNMNPVLQTVLKRKRTTALLPEILKIVYRNVSRDVLGLAELSQCRLVSKHWMQSVDDILSDQQTGLAFCREYSSGMTTWTCYKHPTPYIFSFMPECVERLALESYAGIRPFPGGHLVVNEIKDLTEDTARFRLAVTRMLRKFGSDVKYFGLRNEVDYNPICWYLNLIKWLRLMPNLKRLDLLFYMEVEETTSYDYFCALLNVYGFPRLDKLRVLQVENVPGSVISFALKSNPQIQKLRVIRKNIYHFPPWGIPMDMNSLSHFFLLAYSYRDIMQLEKIDSSLEAIQIETSGSTGIYNSSRVFRALEKFRESLKYLKLELRSPPDAGLFLYLSRLNELNLIFHSDINIDFILPLKSLQRFTIKILSRRFLPSTKFEMVKFNSCIDNMKESNIWDLFPQLEIVTIYAYNCRYLFKGKHTFVCHRPQVGVQ